MEEKELLIEKDNLKNSLTTIKKLFNENLKTLKIFEGEKNQHLKSFNENLKIKQEKNDDEETDYGEGFINNLNSIDELNLKIKNILRENKMLRNIFFNPYFGKIVFTEGNETYTYYVGIKNVIDNGEAYIVDWRTPICSLYYDGQKGKNEYYSPDGKHIVDLLLKRQLKIENRKLQYYIDVDNLVNDDFLMQVLSGNTNKFMKNIVSTIQTDQNKIIRDEIDKNVFVNGIAGSGKTSVGMHRIAYLLFKERDNLSNKNFLIISPNMVFTNYISKILPELGENNVKVKSIVQIFNKIVEEIGFSHEKEEVVEDIINGNYSRHIEMQKKYDSKFYEELVKFLSQHNSIKNINTDFIFENQKITRDDIKQLYYKSDSSNIYESFNITAERVVDKFFYKLTKTKRKIVFQELMQFFKKSNGLVIKDNELFIFKDIKIDSSVISKKYLRETYLKKGKSINRTATYFSKELFKEFYFKHKYEQIEEIRDAILKKINNMMAGYLVVDLYKKFLKRQKLNPSKIFNQRKTIHPDGSIEFEKNIISYEDLPALAYIKTMLYGLKDSFNIKHIFIDEVQDYDFVSIELLKEIYPKATFTMVGDFNQNILFTTQNNGAIKKAFENLNYYELSTNFRSTFNIAKFANKILGKEYKSEIIRIEDEPELIKEENNLSEIIENKIKELKDKNYKNIAIICKDNNELIKVKNAIGNLLNKIEDILLTTIFYAKGLEFDAVILPYVNDDKYYTDLDKQLLYIACTRANHNLTVIYSNPSKFILN